MGRHAIIKLTREEILEKRASGLSDTDIARGIGVTRQSVQRHFLKLSAPTPRHATAPRTIITLSREELAAKRAAGLSDRAIARALGVSGAALSRYRLKLGVQIEKGAQITLSDAEWRARIAQGASDSDIAREFGMTKKMVRNRRWKLGIRHNDRIGKALDVVEIYKEVKAIATDRGKEARLYRGQRYEDDPRAARPEPLFRGAPKEYRSLIGCGTASCSAFGGL